MTTTLINPVTAEAFTEVPSTDLAGTDAAIERAHEAFLTWRSVAPGERARLLRAFAAIVDAHNEELALLEVTNAGHTIGIAGWGFAPAIAAGNAVVLKPAEITPLTAIRIAELAVEAGLPPGVLTVIPGKGSVVGQRFVTHPLVRKVCFTGSTEVGKQIMAGCADQLKKVTLELGGKSANIIFADADVAAAAASAPY